MLTASTFHSKYSANIPDKRGRGSDSEPSAISDQEEETRCISFPFLLLVFGFWTHRTNVFSILGR